MSTSPPYRVYNAESFGAALRHFRQQAGLTQAELAERVGIQRTYLAELEGGKTTEQTERLIALFRALGVRVTLGKEEW